MLSEEASIVVEAVTMSDDAMTLSRREAEMSFIMIYQFEFCGVWVVGRRS